MDVNKIKKELLAFSKYYNKQMELESKKFAEFVEKSIRDKLNETLKHPSFGNPRGRIPGFQGAKPMIRSKITPDKKGGYKIEIKAFMARGVSDQRHFVWHMINKGRKPYKAKKWQTFPVRAYTRTTPNQYTVLPYSGYGKKWVSIAPGRTVYGYEGRNFYETIMRDVTNEIKLKYPDFDIIKMKITN